ncbi:histidine kinase [Prevotella sp. OH937_COT-195]|uniref:histidine kinase n=1 Tax=Prevotella sp. OH937_COT-195 TaxID=2491051 RepID=UPI000F64D73F|nr:histidine kinase [Prevotella sp. OH937_COT-195]RRD02659.1 histidine kinase [Prevotella sp. OH937_COT-195]
MQEKKKQSILYDFLMEKRYKWSRHFVLVVSVGVISANHVFITYGEQIRDVYICGIIFAYMAVYLSMIYLNMFFFFPRLLLTGKYVQYTFSLLAAIFAVVTADIVSEYYVHVEYKIPLHSYSFFLDGRNKVIDFFSDFSVLTLSVTSITVIIFYKHWIHATEKMEQLETRKITTDLERLKSNIGTKYLLDKLSNITALCMTAPAKVSPQLLTLSRIIRYRLYECNDMLVLLNSEIRFLTDYLELEKEHDTIAEFSISCQRDTRICFIPPLTLLSFMEEYLSDLSKNGQTKIKIGIEVHTDMLVCILTDNGDPPKTNKRISAISKSQKTFNTIMN